MEETKVSFEVAKLLKEICWKLPTTCFYFEDGEFKEYYIQDTHGYYGDEYEVHLDSFYKNWNNNWKYSKDLQSCFGCKDEKYQTVYSAPTQSLAQKWLREKHSINVFVEPTLGETFGMYAVYATDNEQNDLGLKLGYESSYTAKTYEEALEEGLKQACLIVKMKEN